MAHMPKLRHLSYLVALADELHFGHAAERCHVTQSTLSKGLQELEATLGVVLAERTKRQVTLTAIGHQIADRARLILREVDAVTDLARASCGTLVGDLRLGVIPTVGPYLLPRAMPQLRAAWPDLRLYLREGLTEDLLDALADGRLDAAIVALPFDLRDFASEALFRDGYQLACSTRHPLSHLAQVAGADLSGNPMMLLERGHCLQRHALSAFPQAQIAEDRGFAATSLPTLIAMVEEGLGITLLPNLAVEAGVARGLDISLIPAPGAAPREIALVWRATSSRAADFAALAQALRAAAGRAQI